MRISVTVLQQKTSFPKHNTPSERSVDCETSISKYTSADAPRRAHRPQGNERPGPFRRLTKPMSEACPECGSERHIEYWKEGDIVCSDCGLVLAEHIFDTRSPQHTSCPDIGLSNVDTYTAEVLSQAVGVSVGCGEEDEDDRSRRGIIARLSGGADQGEDAWNEVIGVLERGSTDDDDDDQDGNEGDESNGLAPGHCGGECEAEEMEVEVEVEGKGADDEDGRDEDDEDDHERVFSISTDMSEQSLLDALIESEALEFAAQSDQEKEQEDEAGEPPVKREDSPEVNQEPSKQSAPRASPPLPPKHRVSENSPY